jgi:hypothetical protein
MITVFFTPTRLLALNALPHGQTFTQNYYIIAMLPMLREENAQLCRKHSGGTFSFTWAIRGVPMASKSRLKLNIGDLPGAPHPFYSPDLSPWDFWLFGLMKHSLKNHEIQGIRALITAP